MIAQQRTVAGILAVAIESRAARGGGLDAQARRASSVAREALAAVGRFVHVIDGAVAGDVVWIADADVAHVLAVLAAAPALPIADTLPWATRTALRVLGVPMLASPPPPAAVRVLIGDPSSPCAARATSGRAALEATGYRVTFAPRA